MKIICVANNFSGLSQISAADEPVFFHKPDTSPLTHNRPFFIPDFCKQLFGCLTWIIRLDKLGKYVDEKFAHTYFHEIAAGINLYDAQKLAECQQNGNPWEEATCFENSLALSEFQEIQTGQLGNGNTFPKLTWTLNGQTLTEPDFSKANYSIFKIIASISRYYTIKTGDLIVIGGPISIPLQISDCMEVFWENSKCLRLRIK